MKNIVKKILVGCISLTIIIIMISAVIIIKNKSLKAEENIKTETSKIVQDQDIAKEKIPEEVLVAEIENNEIIEEIVQEEPVTEEKTIESEKQTKQPEVNKSEQNKNTKVTTQSTKQNNKISENPSTNTSKVQTNNDNTNKPKEDNNKPNVETNKNTSNTNNSSTTSQTSNATSTTPSNQKIETFKYNKQMTDKMIKVITTNESEYMKQYGYNVVVDEGIIENTNQFTFAESRVKNYLTYKFGTIRVYARDYIVNGQYMWTECFIL